MRHHRPSSLVCAIAAAATCALAFCAPALAGQPVVKISRCTEQALRAAIAGAPQDATIRFGCDGAITLTQAGGGGIEVAANASLDRRLTIDGTGRNVTLSGGGDTRILAVDGGVDLTLRRLTLRDGQSDGDGDQGGGAVLAFGTLTADRVLFQDNRAFQNGGAIHTSGPGGRLTVTNSRFVGNRVTCPLATGGGGGAISIIGRAGAEIRSSSFEDNGATGAGAGGAVAALRLAWAGAVSYQPVAISHSTFERNFTDGSGHFELDETVVGGGAVAVVDRGLSVSSSRFTANRVSTWLLSMGGAISASSSGAGFQRPPLPLTIDHDVFERNAAEGIPSPSGNVQGVARGGAVGVRGNFVDPLIDRSEMVGNSAQGGGAVWAATDLTIDRSRLAGNTATDGGADGAILSAGSTTMRRTKLEANAPRSCAGTGYVDGGGNKEKGSVSCPTALRSPTK